MKSTIILIIVSFDLAVAKIFQKCEFAQELHLEHEVPREEIYKHLCIANTLHQTHADEVGSAGHLGIYGIGSMWWCGQGSPGGSCNVSCSNLLDDDITDDLACASLILSQQTLAAWGKTDAACKRKYQNEVEECLSEFDIEDFLMETGNPIWMVTTIPPTTTTTVAPVPVKPTSTASPHVQLEKKSSSSWKTAIFLVVIAVVIAALITIKYRRLQNASNFRNLINQEFTNPIAVWTSLCH